MPLETVIRPFVGKDTTPRRVTNDPPQQTANVVLQIGKSGTGKVFNGSYSASATTYKDHNYAEQTKTGNGPT